MMSNSKKNVYLEQGRVFGGQEKFTQNLLTILNDYQIITPHAHLYSNAIPISHSFFSAFTNPIVLKKILQADHICFNGNRSIFTAIFFMWKRKTLIRHLPLSEKRSRRIFQIAILRAANIRSKIICISNEIEAELQNYNFKNVYLVKNSVPQLKLQKKIYDVGFIGRLEMHKGVLEFLRAIRELNEQKIYPNVIIAGTGSLEEKVKEIVAELVNVEFSGFLPNAETIISKTKYLVLYSTKEGLPLTVIEAMSCGTVPILKREEYVAQMLNSSTDTGCIVVNNHAELVQQIKSCYMNRSLHDEKSEKVQLFYASEYNFQTWQNKWREALTSDLR